MYHKRNSLQRVSKRVSRRSVAKISKRSSMSSSRRKRAARRSNTVKRKSSQRGGKTADLSKPTWRSTYDLSIAGHGDSPTTVDHTFISKSPVVRTLSIALKDCLVSICARFDPAFVPPTGPAVTNVRNFPGAMSPTQYTLKNPLTWNWRLDPPFREDQLALKMFQLLARAIRDYTEKTDYNTLLLLDRYMSSGNLLDIQAARTEYFKLRPEVKIFTRIVAFLTTQCKTPVELVVYRGFKDKRGSESAHIFQTMKAIRKRKQDLAALLKNPTGDIPKEGIQPQDLLDEKSYGKAMNLVDKLTELSETLNNDSSRDVDQLLRGVGESVHMETFLSTSLAVEQSRRFMQADKTCCMLQITIPAGSPCLYVSPMSAFTGNQNEYEVLLPPCSHYIVKGRTDGVTRLLYEGPRKEALQRMDLDGNRLYVLYQLLVKILGGRYWATFMNPGVGQFCGNKKAVTERYGPLLSMGDISHSQQPTLSDGWFANQKPELADVSLLGPTPWLPSGLVISDAERAAAKDEADAELLREYPLFRKYVISLPTDEAHAPLYVYYAESLLETYEALDGTREIGLVVQEVRSLRTDPSARRTLQTRWAQRSFDPVLFYLKNIWTKFKAHQSVQKCKNRVLEKLQDDSLTEEDRQAIRDVDWEIRELTN